MGFEEEDYNKIIYNNFKSRNSDFFNIEKLNRMAGNSIVVNVLEEIFEQIEYINTEILEDTVDEGVNDLFSFENLKSKLADLVKKQNESYQIIKS